MNTALAPTTLLPPPAVTGPCRDCNAPSTRTIGRYPYCDDCADQIVADIRARILSRDGTGIGTISGSREPNLGPHIWQLACSVCQATWSGRNGDPCPWCQDALERQRADQRAELLTPPWLTSHTRASRYDELSAIDRTVWDHTRGHKRNAGSRRIWGERLGRAVQTGLITATEADTALNRAER